MPFLTLVFAAFGAVMGSFVGLAAERVNTGQSLFRGRSRCNSCVRTLGPLDLVPVFSFVFSFGRCRSCKAKIPALYPLLELALAFLFALSYSAFGIGFPLLLFLACIALIAFVVVYDLRHTIVPPEASLTLALLSFGFASVASIDLASFGAALAVAGAIGLAFVLLYALSEGRWMGLGDAPIAFSLSLLAAPYALTGLLFSFWIGALCGILILLSRRRGPRMGIEVPFVPFMAAGYLLAYFVQWNLF